MFLNVYLCRKKKCHDYLRYAFTPCAFDSMRLPFPMESYTLSLARSRYLLFKPAEKWTDSQKQRAGIAFKEYPDIERAYSLSHSLRMIFNKRSVKAGARMNLAKWYREVEESGFDSFNTIAATLYDRSEDILNFYVKRHQTQQQNPSMRRSSCLGQS